MDINTTAEEKILNLIEELHLDRDEVLIRFGTCLFIMGCTYGMKHAMQIAHMPSGTENL